MLKMDLQYIRGILFVRLGGSLDRKNTYRINNDLVPIILKHRVKFLVYNLYELEKIDESGVDALLNTKCAIKANKGKICLCEVANSIKPYIRRLHIKNVLDERRVFELIKI